MIEHGLYKDVVGRKFEIIDITDNLVSVRIVKGESFSNNPIPKNLAESYIDDGFWWKKKDLHLTQISKNYNI